MISSKSPGKLYIAGEYAVVNKGYPAILVAVDQFIEVSLKKAKNKGSIQTFDSVPINFKREKDKLVLDYHEGRLSYVINSINIVEKLAKELNKDLMLYDLSVKSELENIDGKKYGLGSSAAVTVSTIKVLCKLYEIKLTKSELFKLSALVHFKLDSNGSGGDLAASIYGGFIAYKTYDKEWLKVKQNEMSIKELIRVDWPYLEIKKLKAPKNLKLLIGWTGNPASTTDLVNAVNQSKSTHSKYYKSFLESSKNCVNNMIEGFENQDIIEIQNQIKTNRNLLKRLGEVLNIEIETLKLSRLISVALEFRGAAKSSGAGGGDCGIAIFNHKVDTKPVVDKWKAEDIIHLPLNVYIKDDNDDK